MMNLKTNILFYYGLKIGIGILSLSTIILFVKLAGQSTYGQYSLAISFVFFFNNFFSGWIYQIILKYYTIERSNKVLFSFLKKTIPLILLLGILFLSIQAYIYEQNILLTLSVFIVLFFYSLLSTFYQKSFKLKNIASLEVVKALLFISAPLFIYFVLQKQLTINSLFYALFISLFFSLLFQMRYLVKYKNKFLHIFKQPFNFYENKNKYYLFLQYGIPIGLWMACATALNLTDRYLINYYYGYQEVGIYSSVYDLIYSISTYAMVPILSAVHPMIMNSKNNDDITHIIKRALKLELMILPALLLVIFVMSFFSSRFLTVSQYEFLLLSIPILVGAFIWNFSMILHKWLEIRNQTLIMLKYIFIALLVNLIGNIICIPYFGYSAAAFTTVLGFSVYLILISNNIQSIQKATTCN